MNTLHLGKNFIAEKFLKEYWQKEPVVLRGLIANFRDAITPEELAGLACEEFIESRLVTEFESGQWQLRNGPFRELDFTQLPTSNWTLLVQAVDQWLEGVAEIKTLFNFIPDWRVEDIMISYATPGGGVGPHFDYYDVFLIQGLGSRRWQIGARCEADTALKSDMELGILAQFHSLQEFTLNPGDALYIPPRFAHWGSAESESLCYSIGFRAPSLAEMIEGFSDSLIKEQNSATRFEDTRKTVPKRSGELLAEDLDTNFQLLIDQFSDKHKFLTWFGCYVSQVKYPGLVAALEDPLSAKTFSELTADGLALARNPSSRFTFVEAQSDSSVLCFVDGAMTQFNAQHVAHIALICAKSYLAPSDTSNLSCHPKIAELLRQLLNQGSLLIAD